MDWKKILQYFCNNWWFFEVEHAHMQRNFKKSSNKAKILKKKRKIPRSSCCQPFSWVDFGCLEPKFWVVPRTITTASEVKIGLLHCIFLLYLERVRVIWTFRSLLLFFLFLHSWGKIWKKCNLGNCLPVCLKG